MASSGLGPNRSGLNRSKQLLTKTGVTSSGLGPNRSGLNKSKQLLA